MPKPKHEQWDWSGLELLVDEVTVPLDGAVNLNSTVVNMANLPTADPGVAGQLWNNLGVVTVSAG